MRFPMLLPGTENRGLRVRKVVILAIVAASLGTGFTYLPDDRWWMVLVCGSVGVLWLLQLRFGSELIQNVSFLFLAGAGGVGIFYRYNSIWLLTNMVILLIAWDLDRFIRVLQPFSMDQAGKNNVSALFRAHLIRLGIVSGLGWGLGVVALIVQISLNFTSALVLGLLALLSLLQAVRFLRREGDYESA